jgi:hypothetical protein
VPLVVHGQVMREGSLLFPSEDLVQIKWRSSGDLSLSVPTLRGDPSA